MDFSDRKYMVYAIFVALGMIFMTRLFYIQIIDESYKLSADNNVLRYEIQYPARGLIYDRNHELLVYNQVAYDLMVIPRQVKNIDTSDFCKILDITKLQFVEKFLKAKKYSKYKPSIFEKQITAETYATLQEKLYKFRGFFVQSRTVRKYPMKVAASVLGYIGEVDNRIISNDSYYKSGDYIGSSGIEQSYETQLRGKRGLKIHMVDVFNRIKGRFADGQYDSLSVAGVDITLTLDGKLQAYGELLMQNKRGSIVAIEPSTGEILALVTSPTYDPNLLVGRDRGKNFPALQKDSLQPLFNRALMAQYPPGSTFKTVQALIGLQEEQIFPNTMFSCNKSLVNCHNHPSPLDLQRSVQHSCNPYYYMVFKRIIDRENISVMLDKWREHILSFGFGKNLGIDIPGEKHGNIPTSDYYNKIYGKGRWKYVTIYSLAIGQGEVLVAPLQLANLSAVLANRGYYFSPHLIKYHKPEEYKKLHRTTVSPKYFDLIIDGMEDVVKSGTARRAYIDSIIVCGKTGTAENPHGEDHSIFMAFAPKENSKIAVAVFVENAGFGGTWAAPIARLMIEKYLTNSISKPAEEKRILEADFIN